MTKNGFSSKEIFQGIKAKYLRKENESSANCYKWIIQSALFIYKCVAFLVAIGMGLFLNVAKVILTIIFFTC